VAAGSGRFSNAIPFAEMVTSSQPFVRESDYRALKQGIEHLVPGVQ
jgi:hypothetical protein